MVNHYIDGSLVNKGVVVDLFRYREQITHMEYALRSHITQAEYFIIVMIYDVLPRSWKLVLKEGRERNMQTVKFTFRTSSKSLQSDEGLTLETSAFLTFHGGNSTFINSFDKTKFLL